MTRKRTPASPFPTARRAPKLKPPAAAKDKRTSAKRSTTAQKLGAQVHSLRVAAGKSAAALAEAAGISRSMLSRIERGLASPSIEALERLSVGLDVPMSRFFVDQADRTDCSYVPAGAGVIIERVGAVSGYSYRLLGHLLSGNLFVEPYLVTLQPEAKPYISFQHPGLKFIHMVSGRVKYRYGSRTMELKPGDSLLFDATALHGTELIREPTVSYLSIVFSLRE